MSDTIKAALITGVFGLIATIVAAIIGIRFGKSSEQKIFKMKSKRSWVMW